MIQAIQRANSMMSLMRSQWALSGYGWQTVRYLGSSSAGGGVGIRLGMLDAGILSGGEVLGPKRSGHRRR